MIMAFLIERASSGLKTGIKLSFQQMAYVCELGLLKMVHGSLRPIAQNLLGALQTDFPFMPVYCDFDMDDWSAKRGEQTMAEKVT